MRFKLLNLFRKKRVQATRYDALDSVDLVDYWRKTDSRSVDASLDPETRRRLRERARYEIANNSYALGAALAISNAVVGNGARIQVLLDDKELRKRIEWDFTEWQEERRLAEKLRAMRFAKFQDGEAFAVLYTNPRGHAVQLDVAPIDCERVCAEYNGLAPNNIDGIILDQYGNPVSYRVMTSHPGDDFHKDEAVVYPASSVLHWYRRTAPEQHRGAPEIAASLNLFALLRRYTLAVVAAAETAADIAAYLKTDATADMGEYGAPFETMDIERNTITTLPQGYEISQLRAEQPTTTYGDFKREILGEIGRSLQLPVNVITGNSSGYNYASGRLDHQEYQKAIRLEQSTLGVAVMTPIFRRWLEEWALIYEPSLKGVPVPVQWYFDGFEHVDPAKEANAQATRLATGLTNLSIEYGKQGRDWEDALEQYYAERAASRAMAERYGVRDVFENRTEQSHDEEETI